MRKHLCGALAATALAGTVAAPSASAISDRPECEVHATSTSSTRADARIAAVIPLVAGTDPAAYPVSATVTCSVVVDGVVDASITEDATGVAVIAGVRQFRWSATGFKICTTIDYTSVAKDTDHWCRPLAWGDVVDDVNDLLWEVGTRVDPLACPALGDLAPLTAPGDEVYITPEGDVYVLGGFVWDCPPYEPPA